MIAGWVTTEVGRQPWVVYGQMRTAAAVTPSLSGADVLISLLIYVLVYVVVFGAGGYFLMRLMREGPRPQPVGEDKPHGRPARPLSAATEPH